MPAGKLTVAKVRQTQTPGRYSDGGCLYLVVAPGGSKHWIARLTIHGRQTDLGLGGCGWVTLAEAREEAARLRKIARLGGDPRTERRRETLTFEDASRRVHAALRAPCPTFSPGHSSLGSSKIGGRSGFIPCAGKLGRTGLCEIRLSDVSTYRIDLGV